MINSVQSVCNTLKDNWRFMRTITYLLTKIPKNRSDCIDYHETISNVESIRILGKRQLVDVEVLCIEYLIGIFVWVFNDGTVVSYEERFGGILLRESKARQQKSVNNANRRLADSIKRIESKLGLKVADEQICFN